MYIYMYDIYVWKWQPQKQLLNFCTYTVTLYLSNMKKYGLQFYLTEQKQLIRVGLRMKFIDN